MPGKCGTWPEGKEMALETNLVHQGINPDKETGAILTPIVQSTTFIQDSVEEYLDRGFSYSRTANPTVSALEAKVAGLEGAAGGACCFSTGMAATVTVMSAFLKAGDHCVITDCSYGGTNRAARVMFSDLGVTFSFVDFRDAEVVKAAIRPNTKLIFSETPANPTLTLTDIRAVSAVAKAAGILHVCDSTFATPIMTKPIELGADMTLQSLTKFYDGHNVTVGGAVASATKEINDKIHFYSNVHGNILSFPQKALADAQHGNGIHGSMLWFEVKGGTEAGRKLMNSVQRPWSLCENLGATESILTCPAVMTHANMLKEDRLKVGITDGFVRVSCGVENTQDLVAALKKGLDDL
eukprot:g2845.t1